MGQPFEIRGRDTDTKCGRFTLHTPESVLEQFFGPQLLPTPIGKASEHAQMNLFDPEELLEKFIKIVDSDSVSVVREGFLDHLQTVAKTV